MTTEPVLTAHMKLALREIAECLRDLADVLAQGEREDNAAKRGGIAVGLRRAAWRIAKGTSDGWAESEDRLNPRIVGKGTMS